MKIMKMILKKMMKMMILKKRKIRLMKLIPVLHYHKLLNQLQHQKQKRLHLLLKMN